MSSIFKWQVLFLLLLRLYKFHNELFYSYHVVEKQNQKLIIEKEKLLEDHPYLYIMKLKMVDLHKYSEIQKQGL